MGGGAIALANHAWTGGTDVLNGGWTVHAPPPMGGGLNPSLLTLTTGAHDLKGFSSGGCAVLAELAVTPGVSQLTIPAGGALLALAGV